MYGSVISDTIVAISTPPGIGAIGVIRLSGPEALSIAERCFKPKQLSLQGSHTAHFGRIFDPAASNSNVIDEVVATIFRSPTSYTGEDIVELSCHGSPYILQKVLTILIGLGARMASPGEFTLRAFLNGKMDLSQAEAVADLIAAENQTSHDLAIRQMRGGFSRDIRKMRQELIDLAALLELELDFSEEDVAFADRSQLKNLLVALRQKIHQLIDSFSLGNVLKHGVATVIAGRPNAGKSTLLNALLNEDRAIVSAIAGTTRDTIEATLNIHGITFRFVDTAGIRAATDEIEQIGISKALGEIAKSTITLYLADATQATPAMIVEELKQLPIQEGRLLLILNKSDLRPALNPTDYIIEELLPFENILAVSAKHGIHLDDLREMLFRQVITTPTAIDQTIVANTRHYEALIRTEEALSMVLSSIEDELTSDLIALDLRQALHHLGTITGEISSEDLLDSVFSRFCIGK